MRWHAMDRGGQTRVASFRCRFTASRIWQLRQLNAVPTVGIVKLVSQSRFILMMVRLAQGIAALVVLWKVMRGFGTDIGQPRAKEAR